MSLVSSTLGFKSLEYRVRYDSGGTKRTDATDSTIVYMSKVSRQRQVSSCFK